MMGYPIRHASFSGLLVFALASCGVHGERGDVVAIDMEPVSGRAYEGAYPETAYLDIDVTATSYWTCSGALIAPQVVLTAAHCIVGHKRWNVYVGGVNRVSTSAAAYDWPVTDSGVASPAYHDVGLIFLAEPIALTTSYPTIATAPVVTEAPAINVGHSVGAAGPHDAASTSLFEAPVMLQRVAAFPFDYASADVIQPSDSGGPVFQSGTHSILAVNSGGSAGVVQILARVDLVASWIATQVAVHGGASQTTPHGIVASRCGKGNEARRDGRRSPCVEHSSPTFGEGENLARRP